MVGDIWGVILPMIVCGAMAAGSPLSPNKIKENAIEAAPKEVLKKDPTRIFLKENSKRNKKKTIEVLMILWQGETDAERGFLEELPKLGYEVRATVIDGKCDLKGLKQALHPKCNGKDRLEYNPQKYDYIYTSGTLVSLVAVDWLREFSGTTPIIFNAVPDPVRAGLVSAHGGYNGGNLSGIATSAPIEMQLKNAQTLLDFKHLFVLVNPREQNCLDTFEAIEEIAKSKNIDLSRIDVTSEEELRIKLQPLGKEKSPNGRIFYVPSNPFFIKNAPLIFECLHSAGIATLTDDEILIAAGALGGTVAASLRSAGQIAADIVNVNYKYGVSMGAIPVQSPEFSFKINGDTARALNIPVDGENKNGMD